MLAWLPVLLLSAPDAGGLGLLRNATVVRNIGAANVARMTDGRAPIDGDHWDSPHTSVLAAGGEVVWDLSTPRHIGALRLQADNNDAYAITASTDGEHFTAAWVARPVGIPGMQTRTSEPLDVVARYLRLTASGGDNLFSVGELEAYETTDGLAAQLERIVPPPPPQPPPINSGLLLVLAVAGYGAWLLYDARRFNRARAAADEAASSAEGQKPRSPPRE